MPNTETARTRQSAEARGFDWGHFERGTPPQRKYNETEKRYLSEVQ